VEVLRIAGAQIMTTARKAPPSPPTNGVHFLAADLSTAEGATALADAILRQFGGIDICSMQQQ
jgi:NAD(P)-dependent dehydrogenase (short-subunit alcohol dehydrogenase family)